MAQKIVITNDEPLTDIVEMPAIVDKKGKIIHWTPEMASLTSPQLNMIATIMKGTVAWRKFRVAYTEIESKLCDFRGCLKKADGTGWYCNDHKLHNGH